MSDSDRESVEFTGDALDFLKKVGKPGQSIEDVVSQAVGTYAYLRKEVREGAQVNIEKNGKRSKLDLA